MVYAFMADGCEEVEALAVIDLLRRAGEEVELVSIHNKDMTQGSHGIGIKNDVMLKDIFVDAADTLFLPGGGVGTKNLKACEELSKLLVSHKGRTYCSNLCSTECTWHFRHFGRKECNMLSRL